MVMETKAYVVQGLGVPGNGSAIHFMSKAMQFKYRPISDILNDIKERVEKTPMLDLAEK